MIYDYKLLNPFNLDLNSAFSDSNCYTLEFKAIKVGFENIASPLDPPETPPNPLVVIVVVALIPKEPDPRDPRNVFPRFPDPPNPKDEPELPVENPPLPPRLPYPVVIVTVEVLIRPTAIKNMIFIYYKNLFNF